jgi:hypothetical protein
MKELESPEYFVAYLNALQKDKGLKELLRQIYYTVIDTHTPDMSDKQKEELFEDWYSGIDRIYDNVLETVEAHGKSVEFKRILDKYIPQAKKVIDLINNITGGEQK